jgi:hypothetical protein
VERGDDKRRMPSAYCRWTDEPFQPVRSFSSPSLSLNSATASSHAARVWKRIHGFLSARWLRAERGSENSKLGWKVAHIRPTG